MSHSTDHLAIAGRNRRVAELLAQDSIEEALAAAEETEELAAACLPETDVERGKALYNLASIQDLTGNATTALETFQQALEVMRVAVGEKHEYVGRTLGGIGFILARLGRYEEAEFNFVRAIMICYAAGAGQHEFLIFVRQLVIVHDAMSKQESAEAAKRQQPEPEGIGRAHFERTLQARLMRRELDEMPPEIRAFAEQNLDSMQKMSGASSTHSLALGIIQSRLRRGEPFALLLRGFEGEAYDYFIDNPSLMTADPGKRTLVTIQSGITEVEHALHQAGDGHLAALAIASPATYDADQSSEGALLPRLILPDETWRRDIKTVIRLAHIIVVDALGLNPGIRSELETIQQCGKCDNAVILLHQDRSKLDDLESTARILADVTGGALSSDPHREWIKKDHPLLAPFKRVGYLEDLSGTDLYESELFDDLSDSVHFIRSAVRLGQKGTAFAESGQPKAVEYLQVALILADGIPGWAERSVTCFNLGLLMWAMGHPDKAIGAFQQGRAAGLAMRDPANEGHCLTMLGQVYLETRQFPEAVASLLASLAPLEAAEDTAYLTESFRLLCEAFHALGEKEKEAATQLELQRLEKDRHWNRDEAGQHFRTLLTN